MPNPFYVVASGSMVPELEIYDVLIVQGNHPFGELRVGDVIVFDRPSDHNRVIVHRVANVIDDDPRTLRTKGDANRASIPGTDFPITEKEYIGKVEHVIPQIGYVTQALKPPVNYIIIAVIIGVMISKQLLARKKDDDKVVFSDTARDGEDGTGDDVVGDDTDTDKKDADGHQADAPGRDGAAPDAGQDGMDGPAASGYGGDSEYVEDGPQEKGGEESNSSGGRPGRDKDGDTAAP
ncbi:MAG: signal peptidase I [Nitrosopumilaceae archaeon]|nr:signal peptidase I [Nitrosopumilaceae archaeon]